MSLNDELRAWAEEERRAPPPSPEGSLALIDAARRQQQGAGPAEAGSRWWIAAASLALAAALVLAFWLPSHGPASQAPVALVAGAQQLGPDRISLAAGSKAELLAEGPQTLIALQEGALEAEVAPRSAGERFVVRAGDYEVRVVGTAFTVRRDPFAVEVTEGVVEVHAAHLKAAHGGAPLHLRAGERYPPAPSAPASEPPASPPPPATPHHAAPAPPPKLLPARRPEAPLSLPTVDELRELVLKGEVDAARDGLVMRLALETDDADAWILLAQLETRSRNTERSIRAWQEVIRLGQPADAQRARFEAARLLVHDPGAAEALLRRFLEEPDPLAAEARLRLARVLLQQGLEDEAEEELLRVKRDHPGTTPARQASALLEEIEGEIER